MHCMTATCLTAAGSLGLQRLSWLAWNCYTSFELYFVQVCQVGPSFYFKFKNSLLLLMKISWFDRMITQAHTTHLWCLIKIYQSNYILNAPSLNSCVCVCACESAAMFRYASLTRCQSWARRSMFSAKCGTKCAKLDTITDSKCSSHSATPVCVWRSAPY